MRSRKMARGQEVRSGERGEERGGFVREREEIEGKERR